MRPDTIRKHLRRHPFQPIRIHLSDGSSYEVRHSEFAYVTRTEVVIGIDAANDDLPESSVYCDPIHVTRIEPIRKANNRAPKRRPKN